jgi:hypothetical protein
MFKASAAFTLLSYPQNLKWVARRNLVHRLAASKRLKTVQLLKKSFTQRWDYTGEAWARKCFETKWQRLKSYEQLAALVGQNWDEIATPRSRRRTEQQDPLAQWAPTVCATKAVASLEGAQLHAAQALIENGRKSVRGRGPRKRD